MNDNELYNSIRLFMGEVAQSIQMQELQGKDAESYKAQAENFITQINKKLGDV